MNPEELEFGRAEFDLQRYIRVLRKRKWWALLGFVVVVGLGGYRTLTATPVYEARAKLFIGQPQVAESDLSRGTAILLLGEKLQASYAELMASRPIAERAVERENLPISPTSLAGGVDAGVVEGTQLLTVAYQASSASLAQRAVNAVARAFVDEIVRIEAPGRDAPPAVKVSIIEPALLPSSPISPNVRKDLTLALVLAVLAGFGAAFGIDFLDTRVKGRDDLERLSGVPVLAEIPRMDTHGADVHLERDPQALPAEAFRKLRTALQFLGVDHPLQMMLVTSPFAREGKTTTALNLAAAYAQAGLKTILVEADLRRPTMHKIFPSDGQRGLTTALIGRIPLEQAIVATNVRNLSHIPAGAIPPNPVELLASEHMTDIANKLRTMADMVIIDAPPMLPVADAATLASRADGVLLVAKSRQTQRRRFSEAAALVAQVGGRLLGSVLNFQGPEGTGYGYYYYGYPAKQHTFETGGERTAAEPAKRVAAPLRAPDAR